MSLWKLLPFVRLFNLNSTSSPAPTTTTTPADDFRLSARCVSDCPNRSTDHAIWPDACTRFCIARQWPDSAEIDEL